MTLGIALLVFGFAALVAGYKNQSYAGTLLGKGDKLPTGNITPLGQVGDPGVFNPASPIVTGVPAGPLTPLERLVYECNRIAGLNLPYVWGGGHAKYDANGPFDCSGAVSYVLHAAGLLKGPPRVSGGFMLWGDPGEGSTLTVYANAGHVFLRVKGYGDWGTTSTKGRGGPQWHTHTTKGFVARHYPGL